MFTRYALYYTASGAFAQSGAAWLGWDIETGQRVAQPDIIGHDLPSLTGAAGKYGFHGTMKPPFGLAEGMDETGLSEAIRNLCTSLAPVHQTGLQVAVMGRFLALVPQGDQTALCALAAEVVSRLDAFRAPASAQEQARRRAHSLTPAQHGNLTSWGYPFVMEEFRFHMTLTDRMPRTALATIKTAAETYFANTLPRPFVIDALTLVGERPDGYFSAIHRFPLAQALC